MNHMLSACLILAAGWPSGLRAEIAPGDPKEKILAELGEPKGAITQGNWDILLYPNGTVELRDGKASIIDLAGPEVIAARKAAREKAAQAAEQARLASVRDGETRVRELLAAERFMRMPPEERVAAFERIGRLHPGTPMPPEYDAAKTALASQRVAAAETQVVNEKEERLEKLQEKKSQLSSGKRRRFNRTYGGEIKVLEKELKAP